MRRTPFFILLALQPFWGFAQKDEFVRLSKDLQSARHDTTRALLLAETAYYMRLTNPDSAIVIANEAIILSKKEKFPRGIANAFLSLSLCNNIKGNAQLAYDYQQQAYQIATSNNLKEETAFSIYCLGNIYHYTKDYSRALPLFWESYNLYKSFGGSNNRHMIIKANMGELYYNMNKTDSAILLLQEARQEMERQYYNTGLIYCLSRLATIYMSKKEIDKAHPLIIQCLTLSKTQSNSRIQILGNQLLGEYYDARFMRDSAIYYAEKAFEIARLYNYKINLINTTGLLSQYYQDKDIRKAYQYLVLNKQLSDSVYGLDNILKLQRKVVEEKEAKRLQEIKSAARQSQLKQNILVTIIAALALIGGIIFYYYKRNQKSKNQIQKTYHTLRSTQSQLIQSEKMASLGELTAGIAHEIQNPLNFVNNFSEVSTELISEMVDEVDKGNTGEVKAIATDVQQNLEKILFHGKRADAIVKGMLQHSRSGTGQRELTDINALCDEYLRLAYHGLRAKDKTFNARFETGFDDTVGNMNVVPQELGRVILNLINNAFYAVTERKKKNEAGYESQVKVSTRRAGNKVEISVADNGSGIPEQIREKIFQPFFTTKPTGAGTGLGLSLSYDIVKAHGGDLRVLSREGYGAEFIITLPV